MEICDMVCTAPGREGPEQAIRALTRRLQDSDQKVVSLTLTVAETCMKNCGTHFSSSVGKPFMTEMLNISRGSKGTENRETSLRLIQLWAREYEKLKSKIPIFFETYIALKAKGVSFPPEDTSTLKGEER
jgi:growth factor-regulated tyrosine kinase substrate